MIQTSMDPAGVGSLEVQSSLPGRCGWGPRSLDISHAGLDGKSHLSMGDSIAFHCYDSRGFFRVLETWNDQGRMILIIYTYIYINVDVYLSCKIFCRVPWDFLAPSSPEGFKKGKTHTEIDTFQGMKCDCIPI